jgi:hypothetical protein
MQAPPSEALGKQNSASSHVNSKKPWADQRRGKRRNRGVKPYHALSWDEKLALQEVRRLGMLSVRGNVTIKSMQTEKKQLEEAERARIKVPHDNKGAVA